MSDKQSSPSKANPAASKEERLSSALRENLKRRKAQSRQRAGEDASMAPSASNMAPESPEKDKN